MKLRMLATGKRGQVVTALTRLVAAEDDLELVSLGRPELDLAHPDTIGPALAETRPDIVINTAAYTAVDKAETEREAAFATNAEGASALAEAAARLGLPIIQLSTDYVFDGLKPAPYVETDPTGPLSVYGASKLAGEEKVAAANPRHAILRTSWVYSPGGSNFLRTMLRLAGERPSLRVVDDQIGAPTCATDIAAGILAVARRILDGDGVYGRFHMTAAGATSWCGFARAILDESARHGGPSVPVEPIGTADYPTPARRPANSRLDCARIARAYGVRLPHWRERVGECVAAAVAGDRQDGN